MDASIGLHRGSNEAHDRTIARSMPAANALTCAVATRNEPAHAMRRLKTHATTAMARAVMASRGRTSGGMFQNKAIRTSRYSWRHDDGGGGGDGMGVRRARQ